MTDIELYRGESGFKVLQLSAVAFDMDGKVNDPHELMQVEDCWFDAVVPDYPGFVDESAGVWWAQPEQAAGRAVLLNAATSRGEPLGDALNRFAKFVLPRLGKKGGHWANPPGFDLLKIRGDYERYGEPCPWHYKQERCMRTLMSLVKTLGTVRLPDMSGSGLVRHNGLHDAARQATLVQAAYRALGLRAGDYQRRSATESLSTVAGP